MFDRDELSGGLNSEKQEERLKELHEQLLLIRSNTLVLIDLVETFDRNGGINREDVEHH